MLNGLIDTTGNIVTGIYNWEFLQEPAWRWFIAFGGLIAIAFGWSVVLDFMK